MLAEIIQLRLQSFDLNSAKVRFTSVSEIGIPGTRERTAETVSVIAAECFSPRALA